MSERDPLTGRPATATSPMGTGGEPPGGNTGATDQAKAKASEMAGEVKDKAVRAEGAAEGHARNVTESAKGHAGEVVADAKKEAGNLAQEGMQQVRQQADAQTDRAASYLQDLSEQLRAMAKGEGSPPGPLASMVEEGARRAEDLAGRLRTGGLDMAVRDVQRFARQRPGTFLASAFGAGLAVGRLMRNTDTSHLTGNGNGGGQGRGVSQGAELEPSRMGVPATVATGTATTAMPGAPTMPDADPLTAGDPTGVQGGRR